MKYSVKQAMAILEQLKAEDKALGVEVEEVVEKVYDYKLIREEDEELTDAQ